MFNRILVCLDGSQLAEQILPYATEEALRFKSRVVLLQVVSISTTLVTPGIPGAPSVPVHGEVTLENIRREEDEARSYLEKMAKPLREKGLTVKTEVLPGPPVGDAIVSYARGNKIDLIAISTHGHSGLREAVFGSTADHVLRESGLPVLLVRPKKPEK
jgi:nucleotide-binding universal stress UspA family protein